MSSSFRRIDLALCSSLALFCYSCIDGYEGLSAEERAMLEEVGSKTQAGYARGPVDVLPSTHVSLCWSDETGAEIDLVVGNNFDLTAVDALNESWGAGTSLTFANGCSGDAVIPMKLVTDLGGPKGQCPVGEAITTGCEFVFSHVVEVVNDPPVLRPTARTIVHEIGHAIGLKHEHQRPVDPLVPGSGYEVEVTDECRSDNSAVPASNLEVFYFGTKLTEYDPFSVMNYCRSPLPPGMGPIVSDLDRLSINIIYPATNERRMQCRSGCVMVAGGLLLASYGSAEADWNALGGILSFSFLKDGEHRASGEFFPASLAMQFGAGEYQLSRVGNGLQNQTGDFRVDAVSSGRFASIVRTLL